MKVSKSLVLVGLLVVIALVVVFRSVLWPILHQPSQPKPGKVAAPAAPKPTIVTNKSASVSTVDSLALKTNLVRWMESPRRDPFLMQKIDTNQPGNYRRAMEVLTLKAILHQSGSTLAVIDTQVVKENDMIRGYRILAIGAEHVWVEGPIGLEELVFDYATSLRINALKLGGLLDNPLVSQESRLGWPYRVVNGVKYNSETDKGWFLFSGKVLQRLGTGLYLIEAGAEGIPPSPISKGRRFIVRNIPLALADDDLLPPVRCQYVGEESYQDKTLRVFDFGVFCAPPQKTAESLQAQRAFLLEQYAEANKRRAMMDVAAAEKGSASAQFLLGWRYMNGEGVPKDTREGRRWFEKSAAQGNRDALTALQPQKRE